MSNKLKLTKTSVDKLEPETGKQVFYWDKDLTGFGIRVSSGRNGSPTRAYIYQGRINGKTIKITIGKHGTITCEQARKQAKEHAANIALGIDPAPKKGTKHGNTFGDLMGAYIELLEAKEAPSLRYVKNQVTKDLEKAQPRLWKMPATSVDVDDIMKAVKPLVDKGTLRQADKLRSYIRTAYAEAVNARFDAKAPTALRNMGIQFNPARDLRKIKGSSKAKDRALSISELKSYWARLQALPEPTRSILMLHVLTGGQRQQQLSRSTRSDLDKDSNSLRLLDYKGRREEPRVHIIPLTKTTRAIIDGIDGDYLFSADGGRKPCHPDFINSNVKKVCTEMTKASELEGEPFSAGTIRATVETRLIAKPYSVSSDTLAHLLSHGMGGVQQRHYQHHDFFEEKLEALTKLEKMLEIK